MLFQTTLSLWLPSLSVCSRLSVHAMWNMESRWVFNLSWYRYTSLLFWHSIQSAWENSHSLWLSVFLLFLLFLLGSLHLSATASLMAANTGSSKCVTNRCVGTVFVGVLEPRRRWRKALNTMIKYKDTHAHPHRHTHNYIPSKCQPFWYSDGSPWFL